MTRLKKTSAVLAIAAVGALAPAAIAGVSCPWDLDHNDSVGINDLLTLLAAWGPMPTPDPPDFDGDGYVGIFDFLELLANWGPCPD